MLPGTLTIYKVKGACGSWVGFLGYSGGSEAIVVKTAKDLASIAEAMTARDVLQIQIARYGTGRVGMISILLAIQAGTLQQTFAVVRMWLSQAASQTCRVIGQVGQTG